MSDDAHILLQEFTQVANTTKYVIPGGETLWLTSTANTTAEFCIYNQNNATDNVPFLDFLEMATVITEQCCNTEAAGEGCLGGGIGLLGGVDSTMAIVSLQAKLPGGCPFF
jgi:hypothetical protein